MEELQCGTVRARAIGRGSGFMMSLVDRNDPKPQPSTSTSIFLALTLTLTLTLALTHP